MVLDEAEAETPVLPLLEFGFAAKNLRLKRDPEE